MSSAVFFNRDIGPSARGRLLSGGSILVRAGAVQQWRGGQGTIHGPVAHWSLGCPGRCAGMRVPAGPRAGAEMPL